MCLAYLIPYEEQLIPWEREVEEEYANEQWWEDCMAEEWDEAFPATYPDYIEEWEEDKGWIPY